MFSPQVELAITTMLDQHQNESAALRAEVLLHLGAAAKARQNNPAHVIPPTQLATITQTLKTAQEMQARALGFNYRDGKPFRDEDEDDQENRPTELVVRRMTEDEEAALRAAGDKELEQFADDEDQ